MTSVSMVFLVFSLYYGDYFIFLCVWVSKYEINLTKFWVTFLLFYSILDDSNFFFQFFIRFLGLLGFNIFNCIYLIKIVVISSIVKRKRNSLSIEKKKNEEKQLRIKFTMCKKIFVKYNWNIYPSVWLILNKSLSSKLISGEKSCDRLEIQENQTAGRTSEEWSFPFRLFLLPRRQTASACVRQALCIRILYPSTHDTSLHPSWTKIVP